MKSPSWGRRSYWMLAVLLLVSVTGLWKFSRGRNRIGVSSIVLITLDSMRADSLGHDGGRGRLTPTLDRLAGEGIRFDRCLTTAPDTFPAVASILFGTKPVAMCCPTDDVLTRPPENQSLPSVLRQHGFLTGAFISSRVLGRDSGFDRGFDVYDDKMLDAQLRIDAHGLHRPGKMTVDAALSFVERAGSAPLFLWIHVAGERFQGALEGQEQGIAANKYQEEVRYEDLCVKRLLDGLRATDRLRDALVVVVAHHGEGLGEHGEMSHGLFLYDSTLVVPLIFWSSGRVPAGRVVGPTVSISSIAPTLLDLLDLAHDQSRYAPSRVDDLLGNPGATNSRSRMESMDSMDSMEPRITCFETFAPRRSYGFAPLRGIEAEGYKLILAPRSELYRLNSDAGEEHNLFENEPAVAARLLARLRNSTAAHRRPESSIHRVSGVPDGVDAPSFDGLLDPKDGCDVVAQLGRAMEQEDAAARDQALAALIAEHPRVIAAYVELARQKERSGDLPAALQLARQALALNPDDARLATLVGQIDLRLGFHAEAQRMCTAALAVDPESVPAQTCLGWVHFSTGNLEEARICFDRVLASHPGLVSASLGRAECLLKVKNVRLANEDLRLALGGDPNNPKILRLLVETCILLANQEDALKFYRRAIALGTNLPWPSGLEAPRPQ